MLKVENIVSYAKVIQQLLETYDPESTVCVTDREKFIYSSDKLGLGMQEGDYLKPGSMMYRTVQEGKPVRVTVDASRTVYEKDYTCACIPIYDGNVVCGALGWGLGTHQFRLERLAETLNNHLHEVNASTEEYEHIAMDSSDIQRELMQSMTSLVEQAKSITAMNTAIRNIAETTNLIGLNASIEAARAGEAGRTFSVVANEITKLAKECKEATENIQAMAANLLQSIDAAFASCSRMTSNSEQQAAGAEELSSSVNELQGLSDALYQMAREGSVATA